MANCNLLFQCIDPLNVPQRRETSHRKAKGRSILNALQKQTLGLDSHNDDLDEPPEFVDSESEDPAWTPQKVVLHCIELQTNQDFHKITFILTCLGRR